jgi:hypothetical protein
MDDIFDDQTSSVSMDGESEWNPEMSSFGACDEGEKVVNYYFPVEVVIAGSLAPREREIIQAQIYQDLNDAIIDKLT